MNNIKLFSSLVVSALITASCASTSSNTPKSQAPKNGHYELPGFTEKTFANGLTVFFIKDDTLPRVSLTLLVKTGTMQEPADKAGLNALTAYLLEEGSQSRNAMQIADEFGQMGTSLDVSPGYDVTTFYADSLINKSNQLLTVFSDLVISPAFNDKEISRLRSQMYAVLTKKIDNPGNYADEISDQQVYGVHPYGRDIGGTKETLRALTKQEIIRQYLTFYRPNNASLAVVGNFDQAFEKQVEEAFGKWTKRTIPTPKVPAPAPIEGLKVKIVTKKGLKQTQIRVGATGIERLDPDYLPLRLGNEVLGGSFGSRLNQRVRDDLGLTYSIFSSFDVKKAAGDFEISTFTKNETAGQALDETLKVLADYVEHGATQVELEAGKNQMIGQFPRAIETADRFAYNLLSLDFYGVPFTYLVNYNKTIAGMKVSEVNEAFRRHLNAQNLRVTVYGDPHVVSQFSKWNPTVEKMK
jgi:zinc protease